MNMNLRKIVKTVLAVTLSAALFAGCAAPAAPAASSSSQAPKEVKSSDYVLAVFKLLTTGDDTAAKEAKVSESIIKEFKEGRDKTVNISQEIKKAAGDGFDISMLFDEKTLKEFSDSIMNLLKNVKATAEEESSDGTVAKVKLSSNYIDFNEVVKKLETSDVIKNLDPNSFNFDITNITALTDLITKVFKVLKDELANYKFSDKMKSVVIEVKKAGDTWEFVDKDKALKDMASLLFEADIQR